MFTNALADLAAKLGVKFRFGLGIRRIKGDAHIMDETHKVAVTRLGDRIRVGGTAQLSGFDLRLVDARRRTLEFVVGDLFPHGGDVSHAEFWTGLRPMTLARYKRSAMRGTQRPQPA